MRLPNGSVPDEPVPIAIRQQVIATWVKAKQLVQHQIVRWHGSEDEVSILSNIWKRIICYSEIKVKCPIFHVINT